ncbi:MAG TPA: molybdenum cofactor biosynthesis protein MoaE [Candidatus Desulfofervidus auxilii]|uniref:Molybdopterin synthase catalytic subunit n=1 Tax=Desulfofervidus auxilii TaxID=1621989 RepID=A0A7C0Y3P0_DESA2|nr:molybdenum cofactor biosynthesis protein MoaE [Candidatus Desulfofervidus auxilii]HDD45147.1 molybdenum cofactor biosynthesis protein MoaE [Candidatus Desulfofervidus auxilii]
MSLDELINKIKNCSRFSEVGMIACHLGIVRGYSRNGEPVKRIKIQVNQKIVKEIISEIKNLPGILEVLVEVKEGIFTVGEPIMAVAVAGDFREHVFPALEKLINSIKTKAVKKQEEIKGGKDGQ